MPQLKDKVNLLETEGFNYIFDRDIFCNLEKRKCFSLEYLEDNPLDIIKSELLRSPRRSGMKYYFTVKPSPDVIGKLEQEFKILSQSRKWKIRRHAR